MHITDVCKMDAWAPKLHKAEPSEAFSTKARFAGLHFSSSPVCHTTLCRTTPQGSLP